MLTSINRTIKKFYSVIYYVVHRSKLESRLMLSIQIKLISSIMKVEHYSYKSVL